jgi:hypothetical protein
VLVVGPGLVVGASGVAPAVELVEQALVGRTGELWFTMQAVGGSVVAGGLGDEALGAEGFGLVEVVVQAGALLGVDARMPTWLGW